MIESARIFARYELENEKGETRRSRNERMNVWTDEFEIPDGGVKIWYIYTSLNHAVTRIIDGFCSMIPPSEYLAWLSLSGRELSPYDYDVIVEMDMVFCDEINKELEHIRATEDEKRKREIEQKRAKG